MTAWSRKLGMIVPSWNTVIEYESWRMMPAGVSLHTARIPHTEDTEAAFCRMADEAPHAAGTLAHASVDAICYACTAGSFFRGPAYDADLAKRLSEATGRPVVTMAGAIVEAARHLGLHRLAVAAPYEPWLMDLLVAYLEGSGFVVLSARGLGHQANVLYPPEKALELAESAWQPGADGLVLSCGNFRTLEMIDAIEDRLGKPVVASNQASVWNLLRVASFPATVPTGGRLLRTADAAAGIATTPTSQRRNRPW